MSSKFTYDQVLKFKNATVPSEVEDELLETYAKYSLQSDMTDNELKSFFNDLELPEILCNQVRREDVCIESTNVIDFDKLIKCTYFILIFMDNAETIDDMWKLLIKQSGRDQLFPNIYLQNHVLSIKDLQKIAATVGMTTTGGIIEMMREATGGKRIYLTYLDFAHILGKLGYLRFQSK